MTEHQGPRRFLDGSWKSTEEILRELERIHGCDRKEAWIKLAEGIRDGTIVVVKPSQS